MHPGVRVNGFGSNWDARGRRALHRPGAPRSDLTMVLASSQRPFDRQGRTEYIRVTMRPRDFLPWRRFVVETSWSPATAILALEKQIDPPRLFDFAGSLPFIGKATSATQLRFRRRISYRNSFLPRIVVSIEPSASGGAARLDVRIRLHGLVAVFMTIWMTLATVGGASVAVSALASGKVGDCSPLRSRSLARRLRRSVRDRGGQGGAHAAGDLRGGACTATARGDWRLSMKMFIGHFGGTMATRSTFVALLVGGAVRVGVSEGARRYADNLWTELGVFLDAPHFPVDNNGSERALRRVAPRRKYTPLRPRRRREPRPESRATTRSPPRAKNTGSATAASYVAARSSIARRGAHRRICGRRVDRNALGSRSSAKRASEGSTPERR